ncbi:MULTISPECIES: aconitate hydratase AcnA [Vibrio harveyi group]|uniref:aconitate hydratase AcnA n=1 Tax=Vibrio harveyi group TaxID=717610 RepID=UPI001BD5F737|nr:MULTISPECIES: aconitate hydratase AcnA [Vibrio harveyi group]MBS9858832.1 aconitate hydratase AcnA [Vibrio alginolyticus]UPR38186.1 aconitate hydratase AcnA [Vibrio parahaemolyticus]WED60298.1 aconitate hydratase AcnA [Vibrio alginolyticus]HBN6202978.1 aconitate hydratase AcnA [Vibrio parahaemolyticus]
MIPTNEKTWRQTYLSSLNLKGTEYRYWSLKKLAQDYQVNLSKIPVTKRLLIENVMRQTSDLKESSQIIEALLFKNKALDSESNGHSSELSFYPSRVLMQDYTGIPALVDLAAIRDAVAQEGGDPSYVTPKCPVDLVIDHSLIVYQSGSESSIQTNRAHEMARNRERYTFLKWAQKNFRNLTVIPPGKGICHQVNLEYLSQVVREDEKRVLTPDTVIGTDSHTTMINGLGVLGWGVGGIEAEAAMLGQPLNIAIPRVVGVRLDGQLRPGVTATDLVLTITERLRSHGVVGKFVEYYGDGLATLSVADRATLANMAPEYGATCGFFPIDENTIAYLTLTNRPSSLIDRVRAYALEQELWWDTNRPSPEYDENVVVDLSAIGTSIAGPKRPQDRLNISAIKQATLDQCAIEGAANSSQPGSSRPLHHGDVVIAAITSCTNTSNPAVMLTAGLVAKAAVKKGLTVPSYVKTSLAPGSLAVARYLNDTGLQDYLDLLGFHRVGYGCTTCIGNSGPLKNNLETEISENSLNVSAVLSGNRNFEGRVHPSVSLNWLASPPLVVAFALAGTTCIDLEKDPIALNSNNEPVYLKDLWPSQAMLDEMLNQVHESHFRLSYSDITEGDEEWEQLSMKDSPCYPWDEGSTYIQRPPFLEIPPPTFPVESARVLAILGDSITTDHISPAGRISEHSPAGQYLLSKNITPDEFNSYGSRRGNHHIMVRGTFSNVRLENKIASPTIGGVTRCYGDTKLDDCNMSTTEKAPPIIPIYDASRRSIELNVPLVIFAGKDYGSGSSRDWAAKGCLLLNVKAVIAESFERIHRSNLVGMGILPLQLMRPDELNSLTLEGNETVFIAPHEPIKPLLELNIIVVTAQGAELTIPVTARIDNPKELEYFNSGGILQYVLKQLTANIPKMS